MNQQLLLYGGIFVMCLALLLGIIAAKLLRAGKHRQFQRTKAGTSPVNGIYLLIYRVISKNFLTKHTTHNIRSRIEIVGNTNERTIRKKVVQIYMAIVGMMLILLGTIMVVTKQLLMILLFVAVLWFLSETLVDFFVIKLKNRLLKQQIKLNDLIRHKYYETGMVDEAIFLACQSLDRHHFEIGLQGQRIHDVLMAKNVEKEMVIYNDTAPNKFLKMLLGLAYMTMEYGDSKLDASSVFMRNMGDLTGEIRIELSKRERLNYALKSLNIIVLIPLFCITPIRNWASNYFMPLKVFYESQMGFFIEIFTMGMIFVCYILLRRIQQFDDQRQTYGKHAFEQKIYDRWLYHVIDFIKPGRRRYYHIRRRLKAAASHLSVEALTTRKLLSFMMGLLFALGFVLALHYNQRHQVLTAPTLPEQFIGGQLSDAELAKADAITAKDVVYLSQMTAITTEEELTVMLEDEGLPIEETMILAERLLAKQTILVNQHVKWWEVALILLAAVASYQLPMVYLYFQQRVLRIDIEDEVAGFSTIILMLMHHERMSVADVLEWMEMYAAAFKEPIGDCLNNVASGLTEALEALKDVSDNERFINIVESLMLASQDITIRQAFDELSSEKDFYMEARKETNQRIVERKINMGRMIGFTPVYGLIVLYMVIPMISTSMTDMQQYFNQLR